jgi:hypothetical protein
VPLKTASIWLERVRSDIDQLGFSRRVAGKLSWDATRFGITPRGVAARIVGGNGPPLISISLPKAGTHLVERALCLHPAIRRRLVPTLYPHILPDWGDLESLLSKQRPGELLIAHIPFEQEHLAGIERTGTKAFLVVRDPRDILISNAFYISGYQAHNWHRVIASQPDMKSKLRLLIEGRDASPAIPGIGDYLREYAGWLDAGCKVIRYEDLVGEREQRVEVLGEMYDFAGLDADERRVAQIADGLISAASPTFRSGGTGQWREHFDDELEELYRAHAEPQLGHYGYG